jgi:hypothetical protein
VLAIAAVLLHAVIAVHHANGAFAWRLQIDALGLDATSICRGGRADPSQDSRQRQAPEPRGWPAVCHFCCLVPGFVLDPSNIVLTVPAKNGAYEARPIVPIPTPFTTAWPPARGPPALA